MPDGNCSWYFGHGPHQDGNRDYNSRQATRARLARAPPSRREPRRGQRLGTSVLFVLAAAAAGNMDNAGKEREAVQLMAEAEKRVKASHSFLRGLFGWALRRGGKSRSPALHHPTWVLPAAPLHAPRTSSEPHRQPARSPGVRWAPETFSVVLDALNPSGLFRSLHINPSASPGLSDDLPGLGGPCSLSVTLCGVPTSGSRGAGRVRDPHPCCVWGLQWGGPWARSQATLTSAPGLNGPGVFFFFFFCIWRFHHRIEDAQTLVRALRLFCILMGGLDPKLSLRALDALGENSGAVESGNDSAV